MAWKAPLDGSLWPMPCGKDILSHVIFYSLEKWLELMSGQDCTKSEGSAGEGPPMRRRGLPDKDKFGLDLTGVEIFLGKYCR